MKKWISTILSVSLVIGMAAVLHACGKPKAEPETTEPTTWSDAADGETSKSFFEDIWEDYEDFDDESYSYTERTTDEHYQEEYDALTLPSAVTTQPAAGTTRAQTTTNPAVRETTTQFQFTSPSRSSTTKPSDGTTKPSGDPTKPSTVAAQQPVEEQTTMLADLVGDNGSGTVQDVTVMPRPPVTYLDRYVVDILESGSYTVQMEMKEEEMPMQITMYVDGDDRSMEFPVGGLMAQGMGLPASLSNIGKLRIIVKDIDTNPKAYVAWTGGYMEMEDIQDAAEMLKEAGGGQDLRRQLQIDRLQYCGKTTGIGSVCETYVLPEENLEYNFYFTQTTDYEGLVRWDVIDLSTKQVSAQMVMRLTKGVADKKVFAVSGKKYSPEDFEGLFGG